MAVARIELRQGRLAEGERLARRSLDIFRAALGEEHPDFARILNLLAGVAMAKGQSAEAERLAARSADLRGRLSARRPISSYSLPRSCNVWA
jgi:hypothetical protein